MKTDSPAYIMGWTERVDFPDWGIDGVLAKLDTGAQTSALHVENLEPVKGGKVQFDVVLDGVTNVRITAELVRTAKVRPSSGTLQKRVVVATPILIGPFKRKVQISLISREHMACRMLVGREALAGAVLVDPSRIHVTGRRREKAHRHVPENRYKDARPRRLQ